MDCKDLVQLEVDVVYIPNKIGMDLPSVLEDRCKPECDWLLYTQLIDHTLLDKDLDIFD